MAKFDEILYGISEDCYLSVEHEKSRVWCIFFVFGFLCRCGFRWENGLVAENLVDREDLSGHLLSLKIVFQYS